MRNVILSFSKIMIFQGWVSLGQNLGTTFEVSEVSIITGL